MRFAKVPRHRGAVAAADDDMHMQQACRPVLPPLIADR